MLPLNNMLLSDKSEVQQMIDSAIQAYAYNVQFKVTPIPAHVHNGVDSNQVNGADVVAGNPYTPTLTAVTNVSSSSASVCNYFVIGSMVVVSGSLTVTPTATVGTELGISLPTPSRFSNVAQCSGTGFSLLMQQGCVVVADTTNKRASLQFVAQTAFAHTFAFTFIYRIV